MFVVHPLSSIYHVYVLHLTWPFLFFFIIIFFGRGDSAFLSVLCSKYDHCKKDLSQLDVSKVYSSENRIFRVSPALNVHFSNCFNYFDILNVM